MIKAETMELGIRIDFNGTREELMQEMGGLAEKFITEILHKDVDTFIDELQNWRKRCATD